MNNLVQGFIYYVDKYHVDGMKYAEKNLINMKNPLEDERMAIGKLMEIFTNKKIMQLHGRKIEKHAFEVMSEEKIKLISNQLLKNDISRKKREQELIWEYHKNNYHALIANLRPLFLAIDFEGDSNLKDLLKAVKFLKSSIKNDKPLKKTPFKSIPTSHIKPKSLIDIFTEKKDKKDEK